MSNLVILVILAAVLGCGVYACLKRIRGERSCCGGSAYKARSRKLASVSARMILTVDGMSCQHCVNRVMEAIQGIEGTSASVNLKKGTVAVSVDREIDREAIRQAVEAAGYSVREIKTM